jgi:uncharacterized protein YbjT (DUF2867 family)
MRVLILGGNGFIGSEICRVLVAESHAVTALARNPGSAERRLSNVAWLRRDLQTMRTAADWHFLSDFDAVVNCAGALQDGARDDVTAVQKVAMLTLYDAAAACGLRLIAQISARTDGPGSDRDFLKSKRHADEALQRSGVPFVIIRPAIVIGRNAHGGSALLRALAAIPWRTPLVYGETPMQFAALADVAAAVRAALAGEIAAGSDLALAAPERLTLREAVALHRGWLGLQPVPAMNVPTTFARITTGIADLLGHLGWRSPLRSTAMAVAEGGVTEADAADPAPPGLPAASLAETLLANPAGVQDLWFARLYLLKPAVIGALSLFWLASGIVALARFDQSSAVLADALGSRPIANALTAGTGLADILLGVGVLVRRLASASLIGMVLVSLAYLAAATVLTPHLWADPLGPLVKVLPSIMLALVALATLDER